MMDKARVYMCVHIASMKSTAGKRTKISSNLFHISTSSRLTSAEAFRNDHVAACSTAPRNATEENESGGNVTVLCPSKVTQRSSTADWLKFKWRQQIDYDVTPTEQIFTFKVKLCSKSWAIETCWICQSKQNYLLHTSIKRWIYILVG